jgi:translocation and assembly module TamA
VRKEIGDLSKREYSPKLLQQIENSAYGTRAFSTVTVTEAERLEGGQMKLRIRVRERKMQEVGFGVLLEVDPIQWSQRAGVRYRHHNLFRNLTDFEASLLGGWAELPNPWQLQAHGPRAELRLRLTKKGLLERKLVWTAEPRVAVDIREGYQLWGVENRLGVSRFFKKVFWFGLSYNNRFADLFNYDALRERVESLGIEFRDPYISSYLELETILFRLDDFTNPHRGARLGVNYQFANQYLGSQFDYHQVQPEVRGYIDPHPRVRLAARARVGFIMPYNDTASAPLDLRFYLGGANDARGWGLRRLSPRVTVCDEQQCKVIPVGGNTEVLGNLEMRVKLIKALWLALYGDVGDVQAQTVTIRPRGWMYSTGTGVRYETPIGPIRFDFAVRVNEDERFPEPLRFAFHFSLGEAF